MLYVHQTFLSSSPSSIRRGDLAGSNRAHVQRGESATARCASIEDHQAPSRPLFREHRTNVGVLPFRVLSPRLFRGVAKAALDCAHRTRAFLGRAFCEQEGHLAAPDLFLIRVPQSASDDVDLEKMR